MSTNLSNIMDDKVYLARDYSSIINWFISKLNTLTDKWTDLTIPQPHTLSLNQIAYVFDLLNYLIDYKFLDTNFINSTDIQFINSCFYFTGHKIEDYHNNYIELTIHNNSQDNININLYDSFIVKNDNSLLTAIESKTIVAQSQNTIKVIYNLPKTIVVKKSELINGGTEYILPDTNINRDTINIYYNNDLIKKTDDALFETSVGYEIIPYGDSRTMFKLSPSFYRELNNDYHIIVRYLLNIQKSLSKDSKIVLANTDYENYNYNIEINNNISNTTINEIKQKYYSLMSKITTLYNIDTFNINEIIKDTKIDYISYSSVSDSNFLSGTIDYDTKILELSLKRIPITSAIIRYKFYRNDNIFTYSKTLKFTDSYVKVQIHNDTLSTIVPGSLTIQYDSTILIDDSKGKLNSLVGKNNINFRYTTYDDTPITTNFIKGTISYALGELSINIRYRIDNSYTISYKYINNDKEFDMVEQFYMNNISDDRIDNPNSISLKYSNIVRGSIRITNNNLIFEDIGNGNLISQQDDYSLIHKRIENISLIDKNKNFLFTQLHKIPFSIQAILYYKIIPVNKEEIIENIKEKIYDKYSKLNSDEDILSVSIIKEIEACDSNIFYIKLIEPSTPISVSEDQILFLQNVSLSIEKSEI